MQNNTMYLLREVLIFTLTPGGTECFVWPQRRRMLLSVIESFPFITSIQVKLFYFFYSPPHPPLLCGFSTVIITLLQSPSLKWFVVSNTSLYIFLLILSPSFFPILSFISPDPHSHAPFTLPPLSFSYLGACPVLPLSLTPSPHHYSPLTIFPPIPVFLVSG